MAALFWELAAADPCMRPDKLCAPPLAVGSAILFRQMSPPCPGHYRGSAQRPGQIPDYAFNLGTNPIAFPLSILRTVASGSPSLLRLAACAPMGT